MELSESFVYKQGLIQDISFPAGGITIVSVSNVPLLKSHMKCL